MHIVSSYSYHPSEAHTLTTLWAPPHHHPEGSPPLHPITTLRAPSKHPSATHGRRVLRIINHSIKASSCYHLHYFIGRPVDHLYKRVSGKNGTLSRRERNAM